MPALKRQRLADLSELETSLVYIASESYGETLSKKEKSRIANPKKKNTPTPKYLDLKLF